MEPFMTTSSNGNIFRVTGPLCGEFTGPGEFPAQWPGTRSFDVFFDLRLNKRLSKQPWGWWFETPPWSLWRHCNGYEHQLNLRGHWYVQRFGYSDASCLQYTCIIAAKHRLIMICVSYATRYDIHSSNHHIFYWVVFHQRTVISWFA